MRGLHPWPGSYTWLGERRLKLFPPVAMTSREGRDAAPGQIVAVRGDSFDVACGDGALRVSEVQEQNRKRMPVSAWLAGRALAVGTRLGREA